VSGLDGPTRSVQTVLVVAGAVATAAVAVLAVARQWPVGASVVAAGRALQWLLLGAYACLPVLFLGRLVTRPLQRLGAPPALSWAAAWVVGWTAVVAVGIGLLASGLYSPVVWQGLAAAGALAAAVWVMRRGLGPLRGSTDSGGARWWTGPMSSGWAPWRWLLALLLLAAVACAMLPPDSRDELAYHLVAPRLWAAQGDWVTPADNPHLLFPGNLEIVWSWALAVGGLRAPRLVTLVWALLTVAVLWEWLKEQGVAPAVGQALLVFLLATPVILHPAAICYVEWPLLLLLIVGWRLSRLHLERGAPVAAVLAAVCWGLALGSKHSALPVVGLLSLEWLLNLRRERPRAAAAAVASLVVAVALLAAPWWVRAWSITGDPVHPFGSLLSSAETASGDADAIAGYGRPPGQWRLWPWVWHAGGERLGDQMMHPLWPVLLVGVIAFGWRWRHQLPWLTVVGTSAVLLPFGPAPRVYLPLMVLCWLFLPRLVEGVGRSRALKAVAVGTVLAAVCLALPVTLASWFLTAGRAAPDYLLAQVGEVGFLERRGIVTPVTEWVRTRTPPDAKVWAWGEDRVFYLDRWVRAGSPYSLPLFVRAAAGGGEAGLSAAVAADGIGYVLVNRARVPDSWTRLDLERRSWELDPEVTAALQSWRRNHLREIVRDDRYVLYQVAR